MQDAFLKVWERWEQVGAMDDPVGYLYRTAMNLFRKRYRRAVLAIRRSIGLAPSQDDFADADERDTVRRVLSTLPPRQRAALVLTEMLGFTPNEAGRALGVQASTVRSLAHQGRASFRRAMEVEDPSVAELLERESTTVDLERGRFERLLRRRDRKRRNQRVAAAALAIILSIVTFVELTRAFSVAERPAATRYSVGTERSSRTRDPTLRHIGDLVAHDPDTGEVRTLVVPDARDLIGSAAWSADGRWAAYEAVSCPSGRRMTPGFSHAAEAAGLWVTNGQDEPRQLTRPCWRTRMWLRTTSSGHGRLSVRSSW